MICKLLTTGCSLLLWRRRRRRWSSSSCPSWITWPGSAAAPPRPPCRRAALRPRHLIALKLLSEHGPTSQQGLAEALSLDPSNVVGLLNELEERGLITRRRDPADRRRHIVELSATGAGELCLAQARLSRVEDDLLSALSAEERATLYRLLARAVDAAGAAGKPSACLGEDQASACLGED